MVGGGIAWYKAGNKSSEYGAVRDKTLTFGTIKAEPGKPDIYS
jgi:hypothetical protein